MTPPTVARGIVGTSGTNLTLDGQPWFFAGANNSMGHFDAGSVDSAFNVLTSMKMRVVRSWAYRDRGALSGNPPTLDDASLLAMDYRQYWDTTTNAPAYNDGADGLQHLDYVLAKAAASDMRVIVVLANNWADLGGVDQYNLWYGLPFHDSFFSDANARAAYKAWVAHLIARRNSITGTLYGDDPTILSWELMNEPFCFTDTTSAVRTTMDGSATSPDCASTRVTAWADEMSHYIHSLDSKHLVSVGDIGFLNRGGHDEYSNVGGDDFEALLALGGVDFGTFHLYIDGPVANRGYDSVWGVQWIADHVAATTKIGKPVVLEEFGYSTGQPLTNGTLQLWSDAAHDMGVAGWLIWDVLGSQPNGQPWPPDIYTVPYPSDEATLLTNAAIKMNRP